MTENAVALGLESRVHVLESEVSGVREDIRTLATTLQQNNAAVTQQIQSNNAAVTQQIGQLAEKVANQTRPQWSSMAAWAGVIISFFVVITGLGARGPLETQARHEREIASLQGWQLQTATNRWTREQQDAYIQQHEDFARDTVQDLRAEWARDLDGLRSVLVSQLDGLRQLMASEDRRYDETLQREMRLLQEPLDVRLSRVESEQQKRIDRDLDWAEARRLTQGGP